MFRNSFKEILEGLGGKEIKVAVQKNVKQEKEKSNITPAIIIILLVLLLAATAVIAFLLLHNKPEENPDSVPGVRGTVVTKDNVDDVNYLAGAAQEPVQDGYYAVSMSIDWHFKNGATKDAVVANKQTNTRTVYFDLLTGDTNEVVYSSPYIPVGQSMEGFTLDQAMEPGQYDMVVKYHLVDDDEKEVSSVSVGVTIYVE